MYPYFCLMHNIMCNGGRHISTLIHSMTNPSLHSINITGRWFLLSKIHDKPVRWLILHYKNIFESHSTKIFREKLSFWWLTCQIIWMPVGCFQTVMVTSIIFFYFYRKECLMLSRNYMTWRWDTKWQKVRFSTIFFSSIRCN